MPKSNSLFTAVGALGCLLCSGPLVAQTLDVAEDSYTRTDSPSRNFGGNSALWISHWSSRHAYLQFGQSTLPNETVISAVLRIALDQVSNDGDIAVHAIQSPWDEASVTAESMPTIDPQAIATASVAPGDGGSELSFDVTSAVQAWQASPNMNFGLAILPTGSNWVGTSIYSREAGFPATLTIATSGGDANVAPVAQDDEYNIERAASETLLDVLTNDADADIPNDNLRIIDAGPTSEGGLIVNYSSNLGYTPPAGFSGEEEFQYTIADQAGLQATATVRVSVTAEPAPTGTVTTFAAQDSYTRIDQSTRNFGSSNTLWVSHWSARQAYLRFAPSTLPVGAVESAKLTVTLASVPNDGEIGLHIVQGERTEWAITGSTLPTIDPAPLATAFVTPADSGSPLDFDVMSVVRGWQASPSTNFGLAILPSGSNWVGASFYSRESDTPAVLNIATTSPSGNAPPVAQSDNYTVDHSAGAVVLDLLSNDSDADLPVDTLQIVSVGSASNGGLVVNQATSVSYTPPPGFTGTESFDYTIADASNVRSTATVYVVVTGGEVVRTWRIMPVGDSITEASGSRDSYRRPLWHLLKDAGVDIDFVGSRSGNRDGEVPNPDFDTDHEGHWGWKADRFLNNDNIANWSGTYRPDVILIHLGTNDIFGGQSVSSTIDEIGRIIDIVRDVNPRVMVLIATIIPTSDPSRPSLVPFNQAIPGLVGLKNQPDSPVLLVDQYSGFDAEVDTYDGVHPDLSGETKMAQKWFDALRTLISPN